jgi:hypothetical protein
MSTRLPPVLATPFVSQTRPMKGSGPVREERRLQQTRDPYKALQVVIPRQKQFERLSSQPASSFTPYDPQKGFHEVLPEEGGKRKYKDGSDAFNSNPVPKRVKQNLNKLDLNRQIPDVKSLKEFKSIMEEYKRESIPLDELTYRKISTLMGVASGALAVEILEWIANEGGSYGVNPLIFMCTNAVKKASFQQIFLIFEIITNKIKHVDSNGFKCLLKGIGSAIENSPTGEAAMEIITGLKDKKLNIRGEAFPLDIISCIAALKKQKLNGIKAILNIIKENDIRINEEQFSIVLKAIGTAIENSQTGADALEIVQALADGTLTIQNKAFRSDKVLRLEISHCNSALKKQNLAGIKHILRIINSNPKIRVDKKDIDILSKAIGTAIENSQTGADALEIVQALIDGTLKIRNQAFQSDEVFTLDIIQCISALKSQNLTGIRYILGIIGSKFHSQCSERALSFLQMAIGVAIEKSQTGADALEVVQALADGTLTIQNKAFQLDEVLKLTIIQCTSALKKQNLAGIKHILRIITSNPQIRIDKKDIDILSKAIGCAIKNSQTGADALEITEWLSTRPHIKEEIFLELGSEACATFLKQQDAAGIKKIWELMLIQNIPVDELFYKALTICIQNQISSVKIIEILDYVKTSTILAPLPKSEQCLTRFILANTACERAVELGDAINVVAYVLSDSDPFYHPSVTHSKACFKFYPKVSILSIDCHGFSKTLALEYLRTMLVSLEEPDKKEGISGLEFIPGKGIHSNHAPYALKDAIVAMMKGYPQWERAAQPNQGCLMYRRRNTEPLPVMSTSTPLPTR